MTIQMTTAFYKIKNMSLQIACAIRVLKKNKDSLSHTQRSILISEVSKYEMHYCEKCGHYQKHEKQKDQPCDVCNHYVCKKCNDVRFVKTFNNYVYNGTFAICNSCFHDTHIVCQDCQKINTKYALSFRRCVNCKIGPFCEHNACWKCAS